MSTSSASDPPKLIKGWDSLARAIGFFSETNGRGWLFRGVTDEAHELVPKIGRPRTKPLKTPQRMLYDEHDERAVFAMFKQHARAFYPGQHSELEWLAVAQHFGAPTRLLDWSDNLLVAVWFAVQKNPSEETCDSAVWVTHSVPSVPADFTGQVDSIDHPSVFRPPHIAPRIAAQGSVLMVCPEPSSPLRLGNSWKITIRREAWFQLRKRLDACGINERTMFQDLGGVAQYLSWRHSNGYVQAYRDM